MFRYAIVVGNVAVVIFCRPELYVPIFIESLSGDAAFIGYFFSTCHGCNLFAKEDNYKKFAPYFYCCKWPCGCMCELLTYVFVEGD